MSRTPGKKESLPEILETDIDADERGRAVLWLEEANTIKAQVGDEKKGEGLLGRLGELKESLGLFVAENGIEGVRHNKLVYTQRLQEGRETVDMASLTDYLLEHGVAAKLIGDAIAQAKKRGESYWVREITQIK